MRVEHIIVTGGSGYLGSRLIERALAEGRSVVLLGRHDGPAGTRRIDWSLDDPFPADARRDDLPPDAQALVHCAHAWQSSATGHDDNIAGSMRLFEDARKEGIGARVFISSQSARADALNIYGRTKWAIEQGIQDATSLRVGLIYGGPRKAMYGLLTRLAVASPILPMLEPGRAVQPIHLDEVVAGILAAVDRRASGVLALAGHPISFGDFLRLLARAYAGRKLRIFPIPLRLALLGCEISRRLPLVPTVDRERVLGLAGTQALESAADLARLGVKTRPLADRLAAEPSGRKALLAEGQAFMRNVSGWRPPPALLRKYARICTKGAIVRPLWWHLEFLGANKVQSSRLRLASRITEATPDSETVLSGGSRAGRLFRLGASMGVEALLLPLRAINTIGTRRP